MSDKQPDNLHGFDMGAMFSNFQQRLKSSKWYDESRADLKHWIGMSSAIKLDWKERVLVLLFGHIVLRQKLLTENDAGRHAMQHEECFVPVPRTIKGVINALRKDDQDRGRCYGPLGTTDR